MSSESHDPLIDLAGALDVSPSPAFAAGVRRRVEEQPSAPAWRWRVAAATIGGTGLVIWMAVAARPPQGKPGPAPAVAERFERPAVAERAQLEAVSAARPPAEPPAVRPRATAARVDRPVRRAREPEVLVSPDQRLALEQLKAALESGRLDASVLPANLLEAPAQIAPAPMESSDSLGGERVNQNLMRRLEAPRRFVGRVVRTEF